MLILAFEINGTHIIYCIIIQFLSHCALSRSRKQKNHSKAILRQISPIDARCGTNLLQQQPKYSGLNLKKMLQNYGKYVFVYLLKSHCTCNYMSDQKKCHSHIGRTGLLPSPIVFNPLY